METELRQPLAVGLLSVSALALLAALPAQAALRTDAPLYVGPPVTTNRDCGEKLDVVGDVNGDGYDDLLAWLPGAPGPVYLYFGSPGGDTQTPAWTYSYSYASGVQPTRVHRVGDVN